MTDLLEKAFAEAAKLPPGERDAFATWLMEELESERRWEVSFSRSSDALAKLAVEAQIENGARRPAETHT